MSTASIEEAQQDATERPISYYLVVLAPVSIVLSILGLLLFLPGAVASQGGTEPIGGFNLVGVYVLVSSIIFLSGLVLNVLSFLTTPIGIYLDSKWFRRRNYEVSSKWLMIVLGVLYGPLVGSYYFHKRRKAIASLDRE